MGSPHESTPLNGPQPLPTYSHPNSGYASLPQPVWAQRSAIQLADYRARVRVIQAYIIGWIIWIAVGILTSGVVLDFKSGGGWIGGGDRRRTSYPGLGLSPYKKIAHARECAQFSAGVDSGSRTMFGPIYTATSSIPIKLDSVDSAFFYSAGSWSHGHLDIVRDATIKSALVEIEARYDDRNLLDASAICSVYERESNGHRSGVFVQTPEMSCRGFCHQLNFNVKYRIPDSLPGLEALLVNSSIFSVKALDMLPVKKVAVTSSNAPLDFWGLDSQTVELKTTNARIMAQGKAVERATIVSSNGKISGGLTGPDINLKTTNSPIEGEFDVTKRLTLVTSNGKITATANLIGEPGTSVFDVTATSSNDRIELGYGKQPVRSVLHSKVSSSNGAVVVSHHLNYEGSFSATTSNAGVSVTGPLTTHHPSRDGVSRELSWHGVKSKEVEGTISWTGEDKSTVAGTSITHTSNSKLDIVFL